MNTVSLIIEHAAQLITLREGPVPRRGADMENLSLIVDGAVAIDGGRIVAVGTTEDIQTDYNSEHVINAAGKVVTPGLIDPHTHIVFAGSREQEFEMRVRGKSYMEIASAGGGILSSVHAFREAEFDDLVQAATARLDRFLRYGVTTVEVKSGYGLRLDDEIKALQVARTLEERHAISIVSTFLGAHEIPAEFKDQRETYVQLVIEKMIPRVAESGLAEFCDVFCEEGVFTVEESRRILTAARDRGLKLKIHADEFTSLGGAELAVEMEAVSADHLMAISDAGMKAMAGSDTVGVLLPATSFHLGLTQYAPARTMIEAGVAVALSTDCNPGSSMTENLLFVINLAACYLKMTAAESLTACTVNAAAAIDLADSIGRIAPGMQADITIFDISQLQYLPYHIAHNPVAMVIKNGSVVVDRREGIRVDPLLACQPFLTALASQQPAPGGGSASALAAASGAALASMVCNLSKGKSKSKEAEIQDYLAMSQSLMAELDRLIQLDARAFASVSRVMTMPKSNEQEKAVRTSTLQQALKDATETPLRIMRKSLSVLQLAQKLMPICNKHVISDVGVAVYMAGAGLRGASLNVDINLASIDDEAFVALSGKECEDLLQQGQKLEEEIVAAVRDQLSIQ